MTWADLHRNMVKTASEQVSKINSGKSASRSNDVDLTKSQKTHFNIELLDFAFTYMYSVFL